LIIGVDCDVIVESFEEKGLLRDRWLFINAETTEIDLGVDPESSINRMLIGANKADKMGEKTSL
jgi:hypothetical protein